MQDSALPPSRTRSRLSLLLLLGIFAAPVILAWVLFFLMPSLRPTNTTNHGDLVVPVRQMPTLSATVQNGEPISEAFFQKKWSFVYLLSGVCNEACIERLFIMRQVRLTQGKNIKRLKRVLFWEPSGTSAAERKALAEKFPGLVIASPEAGQWPELEQHFSVDEQPMSQAQRLYLVDPMGNLMMSYDPAHDPKGMIKDLRRLLKYSGSG
ncbi:MAG: hypothetical protein V3V12_05695 [Gammaproteobacteria bacterium]